MPRELLIPPSRQINAQASTPSSRNEAYATKRAGLRFAASSLIVNQYAVVATVRSA